MANLPSKQQSKAFAKDNYRTHQSCNSGLECCQAQIICQIG